MFLPGELLPALDDVLVGPLYHVLLPGGSVGTVQLRADGWVWRSLSGGRSQRGGRAELEAWLAG
ncbi:hypothetical protein GCM10008939_14140 [Deinococcus aquiradiocola]|uniref:Uncharacterized protein n=2 Tax=Deinococcus aquiradiocola TaxID=393059 RepID=A0A917PCL2_9DEIO|nr:hypothetical protein GCM10008939_14140 [Deinococcus aquiradiocola]